MERVSEIYRERTEKVTARERQMESAYNISTGTETVIFPRSLGGVTVAAATHLFPPVLHGRRSTTYRDLDGDMGPDNLLGKSNDNS